MFVYTLSGEHFLDLDIKSNIIYYRDLINIFETHIVTDKYYVILNENKTIYTNLYKLNNLTSELLYNHLITIINLTIVFLSYDKNQINIIRERGLNNSLVKSEYKSIIEICIMALQYKDYYQYRYMSIECQENLDIARIYVLMVLQFSSNINLLSRLPDKIKNNKDFIIKIINISQNGNILKIIPDELKKDKEIITTALEYDYLSFRHIIDYYNDDKEIIGIAVSKNKYDNRYRNTLKKKSMIFNFIPKNVINNVEFVKYIINKNPFIVEYISNEILMSLYN